MKRYAFWILAAFVFATTNFASAQVAATVTGDVRVTGDLDELPGGGNAGDENGGNTGLIVGLNTGNVQNWALFGFDTAPAAGSTVSGATISIAPVVGFTNGNHASATDSITIHELFSSNAGWDPGTGTIQNNATNVAPAGVVTFASRVQGDAATAATPWLDASGADVDNFIGAFDGASALGTIPAWAQGSAPANISFNFDQATAQRWVDDGFADLVLQVNDLDGDNRSRLNLTNGSVSLTLTTVPEPSSALLLLGSLLLVGLRYRNK